MNQHLSKIGKICLLTIAVFFLCLPAITEAYVSVKGYTRKDGTYVAPYVRSNPNGVKYDNYGYKPSDGLYNKTYGTRGAEWDTPTYVTDPNYYEGKALYEAGSSGSGYSSYPANTSTTVTAPANATSYGSTWYCNSGYKQVGSGCEKVFAPNNATIYGSTWYCNSGYRQVNNDCEKVIAPTNATIYGSSWYCNSGFRQNGNSCERVIAPPNSSIYGSSWYCNSGYRQTGNSCERVVAPSNATIYGSSWYCDSGFRQTGNSCERVIAPANATIYGASWYCNSGFVQRGNSCVSN